MAVRARRARHLQASLQEGIRAANPALARMLGYEGPEEALWALTDLSHHLFIGGEDELRQIRHTLSQQHGLFGYETRLRRKDGSAIYVVMNLLLKPDEDGLVGRIRRRRHRAQARPAAPVAAQ